jgi:holo-[acyl-carrier protein] synthase
MGVKLREIEVVHDDKGKPDLSLRDEAHLQIEKREIKRIHLSLTHTKKYSTAIVLLEK